jgi:hypothetical protein
MDAINGAASERELEFEEWRDRVRSVCGRYNPEGVGPQVFVGSVKHQHVCGLDAVDLSCSNTDRIERTQRDVRSDGMEHFYALIPLVRDYTHFSRAFRRRFGHAPGAEAENLRSDSNATERAGSDEGSAMSIRSLLSS